MTKWTLEQKEAIEKIGENIIVSAGAGSGKTAVLSERVLTHLKNGINIDEMLILTFTNAAAAEMKDRIRNKILDFDELKDQLDKIDNAYITTFDAYSLSLVKKYNHLLNISDKINIIDDGMLSIKKQEFLEEIFDDYYSNNDEKFLKLIKDFCLKDDREVFNSIIEISDKLDNIYNKQEFLDSYMDFYFNEDNINNLIDEYMKFILRKIDSLKKQIEHLSYYVDRKYIEKLELSLDKLFMASNYSEVKNSFPDRLPSLPKGSDSSAKAIKDNISDSVKKLKELTKYDDVSYMKDSIYKTKDYIDIIITIIKRLEKKVISFKKSINSYEFGDIAKASIRILKENDFVREEIKNSYKEILIDEYQDTNDIQDTFVSLIENNNVYMVGDIKQSIYRFRNANPNLFKSKYEAYSKGNNGYKIDLNKNFRSRSEVIDNINLIFNLIMDSKIGGADYIDSHQMVYGNTAYDKINDENYNLEVLTYEKNDKFTPLEIEIFTIASDIKNKISSYKIMDKDTNKERNVSFRDFVILMDRSIYFEDYKKIFEYMGIPLTIYRDAAISNSLDIVLLKHILNVIINIDDLDSVSLKYSIMSILRSYLFEMDDDDIFDIITNNSFKETELYKLCLDISKDISLLNTKELYDVIIDRFDFYKRIIGVGDIKDHLITLDGIGRIASNLSKSGYTPSMFLDYLKEIENKKLEIKLPTNKEDTNSVKIMTIHTSKGLEYPICYFSGFYKRFNIGEVNDRLSFSSKYGFVTPHFEDGLKNTFLKSLLREDFLDEEVSEELRLFYVALTRAREKMIIVSKLEEDVLSHKEGALIDSDTRRGYMSFNHIINSIYKYLKPYSRSIDISNIGITKNYNLSRGHDIMDVDKDCEKIIVKEYSPSMGEIVSSRFSKNIHKLYSDRERENIDFGLSMHRVFEYTDFRNPNYDVLSDYEKNKVKAFIDTGILEGFKEVYKEYEFIYESDGKEMHGIIDLLIRYDDRYAIVDYKLKNIDDSAYNLQLRGYKKYIEKVTLKTVDIYLYSIADEKLEKISEDVLV